MASRSFAYVNSGAYLEFFKGGVALRHTQGTYQIGMSKSRPCFAKHQYVYLGFVIKYLKNLSTYLLEEFNKSSRQALYSSSLIVVVSFTSARPNSLRISSVTRNFCATSFK